nr:MAG TPA: hypothetical protein [Caudoviricetes sp.]
MKSMTYKQILLFTFFVCLFSRTFLPIRGGDDVSQK